MKPHVPIVAQLAPSTAFPRLNSPHGPRAFTPATGRASRLARMAGFLVDDTCGGGEP